MSKPSLTFTPNLTTKYVYRICQFIKLTGGPNYWIEDLNLPKYFGRTHVVICNFLSYLLFCMTFMSIFTKYNFTEKQKKDQQLFVLAFMSFDSYYLNMFYYKDQVKDLLVKLSIEFKKIYNVVDIEKETIKKTTFYMKYPMGMCLSTMIAYGVDALMQVIQKDEPFITVITAWPDVESRTWPAAVGRVLWYLLWCLFIIRTYFGMCVPTTFISVCVASQYKILQSYFESLNAIFDEELTKNEKEAKFEDAIKVGIQLHVDTLRCIKQMNTAFAVIYGGQISTNITVLVILMLQIMTVERSITTIATIVTSATTLLICTGFIMGCAGDITVEASKLHTSMFGSGWQNCTSLSLRRLRPLLVGAMSMSQRPVELSSIGIIKISYKSYVSIVKCSYSLFSVFY